MPIDLSELTRLVTAGAIVAVATLPVGLVAFALRSKSEPFLPRWKPFPVPWSGFEVTVAFLVVSFVIPLVVLQVLNESGFYQFVYGDDFPHPKKEQDDIDRSKETITRRNSESESLKTAGQLMGSNHFFAPLAVALPRLAEHLKDNVEELKKENELRKEAATLHATLRMLWASLLALPISLATLALTRYSLYPKWQPNTHGSTSGKIGLAVIAWCVLAPVVMLLNAIVTAVSQSLDVPQETHSLAKLGGRPLRDQILLVLEACIGAPLREEIIIRGMLLWWCVGRMRLPGTGVQPVTNVRPWFVMAAATLFAATSGKWQPVSFACVLAVGLGALWRCQRTGARRARAVYATAAIFALMHSVWPNPIPLFVLGLGLGWLAVRTNGLLVPVLVHAMFNAVSVVLVLRGAT